MCLQLANASAIHKIPSIITEHYKKGLGESDEKIKQALPSAQYIEKINFSACAEEGFLDTLSQLQRPHVVVIGTEAHVCVLQTCLDLLQQGYPANWNTANMHYWNVTPSGTAATNWPGVQMTDLGNGWWSYTIPNANCANIVFNDNGGAQTTDLSRCGDGAYDNGWASNTRSENAGEYFQETLIETSLGQSFPNPATGITTIKYSLAENANVNMTVYDLHGKSVVTLIDKTVNAGENQIQFDSSEFENGVYLYVLTTSIGKTMRNKLVIRN